MEEIFGSFHDSTGDYYADKALMSPENLLIPADYGYCDDHHYGYHYDHDDDPWLENNNIVQDRFQYRCAAAASDHEAASIITPEIIQRGGVFHENYDDDDDEGYTSIKAKIASHPYYPKLLDAYIDCQKVGAPSEIASLLDEIRLQNNLFSEQNAVTTTTTSIGADRELDDFMENYCEMLVKYKSDLSENFNEANTFLNKIEAQLGNLCRDNGGLSSDDEFSGREFEAQDAQTKSEDRELKDRLLRKYGSHVSTLKLEFSKKKKKGKLPKEARQTLLEWWNVHYKWPYPTEADKTSLAELTGLDQKQINNWFINQRKRHWRPSENNMQFAVMDNLSAGQFFTDD